MGLNIRLIDDPNTPTALYRYFDEQDRLLYVGISGYLPTREHGHISKSRWMELAARSAIGRHPTRREALLAEREAIRTELPLFNVQDAAPGARQRLRSYLEEIGRLDLMLPRRLNVPLGELDMAEQILARQATADDDTEEYGPDPAKDGVFETRLTSRDEVVLMCTAALQDDRLSLAARGLLALVISLPDRETTSEWLMANGPDSEEVVQAALGELEAHGYYRDGVISDAPRKDAAA